MWSRFDPGDTALTLAVWKNQEEVVKELLTNNANVNVTKESGEGVESQTLHSIVSSRAYLLWC